MLIGRPILGASVLHHERSCITSGSIYLVSTISLSFPSAHNKEPFDEHKMQRNAEFHTVDRLDRPSAYYQGKVSQFHLGLLKYVVYANFV